MKIYENGKNEGITLIALVVTIVVLLILAGITISMLFSENGIITKARQAADETAKAEENEAAGMQGIADEIDKIIANDTDSGVTNPYEPDEWVKAWTCTDGTWSDEILAGTTISDDVDIVAKLYETGNKITPTTLNTPSNMMGDFGGKEYTFQEGNEYKLVIEGQGEMGSLLNIDSQAYVTEAYAWQYSTVLFMAGYNDTCISPYISEIIICDGITNVGVGTGIVGVSLQNIEFGKDVTVIDDFAFALCTGIKELNISKSNITDLGDYIFYNCINLKNVELSNTVVNIGQQAFCNCLKLENISIPSAVNIASSVFWDCESLTTISIPSNNKVIGSSILDGCLKLSKIKILTVDSELTVYSSAFCNLPSNSVIYVLNEEIKTKLEGTYDSTDTTVQVVTLEEMNEL